MIKNWKSIVAAFAIALTMFGAGAAFTSQAAAQTFAANRGEYGSARNIMRVKSRLEALIDQLSRDRRDYGGHRVAAIADMQRARGELQAAIDYDATHGH